MIYKIFNVLYFSANGGSGPIDTSDSDAWESRLNQAPEDATQSSEVYFQKSPEESILDSKKIKTIFSAYKENIDSLWNKIKTADNDLTYDKLLEVLDGKISGITPNLTEYKDPKDAAGAIMTFMSDIEYQFDLEEEDFKHIFFTDLSDEEEEGQKGGASSLLVDSSKTTDSGKSEPKPSTTTGTGTSTGTTEPGKVVEPGKTSEPNKPVEPSKITDSGKSASKPEHKPEAQVIPASRATVITDATIQTIFANHKNDINGLWNKVKTNKGNVPEARLLEALNGSINNIVNSTTTNVSISEVDLSQFSNVTAALDAIKTFMIENGYKTKANEAAFPLAEVAFRKIFFG